MAITKTHLVKQIIDGKVFLGKTECGLSQYQKNGRFNYIVKTQYFKNIYMNSGTESCCEKCLAKAKEQGRV